MNAKEIKKKYKELVRKWDQEEEDRKNYEELFGDPWVDSFTGGWSKAKSNKTQEEQNNG